MVADDPFLALINKKKNEETTKFCDALLWGFSECRTDYDLDFVSSCQDFYDKTGFLTNKQVSALFAMDKDTF